MRRPSTLKERYAKEEKELWLIAYEAYQNNLIKCSIGELSKYLKARMAELSAPVRASPSSAIGLKRRKLDDVTPPASPPCGFGVKASLDAAWVRSVRQGGDCASPYSGFGIAAVPRATGRCARC